MKHGFTLLELIVGTLVASMIGSLLLTALYQSSRVQRSVNALFDTSLRVGLVSYQLEQDLCGAFIPTQARIKDGAQDEEQQESAAQKNDAKKVDNKKENDQANGASKEKKSKPAEKPIEKIFYSINKGPVFESMTFITNNPLVVYVGKDVGTVKPKLVRVQYQLKVDETREQKDSFILFRQESNDIDLAKYGSPRSYELIRGIKDMSITYTARIEKKEQQKQAAPQQEKQKAPTEDTYKKGASEKEAKVQKKEEKKVKVYEYKNSKEWSSERSKDGTPSKEDEQEMPRIPYHVEIALSLWNAHHSKAEDFILSYEIPVDMSPVDEQAENDESAQSTQTQKNKDQKEDTASNTEDMKQVDKNKQARNEKNELYETVAVSIGNLTKILSKGA